MVAWEFKLAIGALNGAKEYDRIIVKRKQKNEY